MGKVNSRRKGKTGELEAAALLNSLFPRANARRAQQYKGTADSADLDHDLAGLHVEVKRRQSWQIYQWMHQLETEAGLGSTGLLLVRKDREPWVAMVYAEHLPQLIRILREAIIDARSNEEDRPDPTDR